MGGVLYLKLSPLNREISPRKSGKGDFQGWIVAILVLAASYLNKSRKKNHIRVIVYLFHSSTRSFYHYIFCATSANCPLKDRLNLFFLKDGLCAAIWFLSQSLDSYLLTASVTHHFLEIW